MSSRAAIPTRSHRIFQCWGYDMPNSNAVERIEPENNAVTILDVIRQAASSPTVDVEKMERLMAMHERITAKQAEAAFNAAMSLVQAATSRIAADATNTQTKSKYATYAALDRIIRPLYTEHGFALSYDTGDGAPEAHVRVLCHVSHRDGHTRTYRADIPADGKGAKGGDVMTKTHATGSAFTYGQRYLLKLIFNVAIGEQDDDGNGGSDGPISPQQKDEVIRLIKETGADTVRFLAYIGAATVDDIPANRFSAAIAALNQKKGRK